MASSFISWQTGIMAFSLVAEGGRANVLRNWHKVTYCAIVDGVTIGRLYRSERAALKAAVKAIKS